jgi:Cobalamin synthesis protein cobW C-terminal domain
MAKSSHRYQWYWRKWVRSLEFGFVELDCFLIHGSSLSVSDELTPSIDPIQAIDRLSRMDVNQLFCGRSGLAFEYKIESGSLSSQIQTLDKLTARTPTILSPQNHEHQTHNAHESHHHEHHAHEHHHHHSSHLDNDGFVSISFEGDRPFDVKKFEKFLQLHLPSEVFRAKGILWFMNSEDRHIFQLSGARFKLDSEPWQSAPKNQLVFIGRNLDADLLRQHLTDCFA